MFVCPFFRPHGTAGLQLDGYSCILILDYFFEIFTNFDIGLFFFQILKNFDTRLFFRNIPEFLYWIIFRNIQELRYYIFFRNIREF